MLDKLNIRLRFITNSEFNIEIVQYNKQYINLSSFHLPVYRLLFTNNLLHLEIKQLLSLECVWYKFI